MMTYSTEITNPSTGESVKRNSNALALLVSKDGLLVAHGHMQLENREPFNVKVKVGEGDAEKEYDAKVLTKPDDVNITFLQIEHDEPLDLPHISFDANVPLGVGEPALIFGVFGESLDHARGTYFRRIAAVLEKPRTTYCLDESIPLGFVGGPVITSDGNIVGVVGFDLAPSEGGDVYVRSGHPLVFQSDLFAQYIENPPSEKKEDENDAWLGILTQPLTDDMAEYWGLEKNGGIVVATLIPGAPAEQAGLQRGDVITQFNGKKMDAKQNNDVFGFTKLVKDTGAGQNATLNLVRNGEPMEIALTLGDRPVSAADAGEYEDKTFGITAREITRELRIQMNLPEEVQGVFVWRVRSGSWASLARLRPGVIILRFGEHPTANLEEFEAAVKAVAAEKPSEIAVFCRAGARTGFFRLQPAWDNGSQE